MSELITGNIVERWGSLWIVAAHPYEKYMATLNDPRVKLISLDIPGETGWSYQEDIALVADSVEDLYRRGLDIGREKRKDCKDGSADHC
jgi:hypothetical protein